MEVSLAQYFLDHSRFKIQGSNFNYVCGEMSSFSSLCLAVLSRGSNSFFLFFFFLFFSFSIIQAAAKGKKAKGKGDLRETGDGIRRFCFISLSWYCGVDRTRICWQFLKFLIRLFFSNIVGFRSGSLSISVSAADFRCAIWRWKGGKKRVKVEILESRKSRKGSRQKL